jgi:hypothetical protein
LESVTEALAAMEIADEAMVEQYVLEQSSY